MMTKRTHPGKAGNGRQKGKLDKRRNVQTCNVLGQDICKIRTETAPQQHVTSLSSHASGHNWGITAYCPSVPRNVAGCLNQLVEQGFIEHKTSAGHRNVRKKC